MTAVLPSLTAPLPSTADDPRWEELVAAHSGLLRAVTRRHGLSAADADDVVQETWVRFVVSARQIRDPERVPGWLATTARRECVLRRRRTWREGPTPDGVPPEVCDDAPDPVDRWAAQEQADRLRVAVRTLPGRERALVELLLEPEPVTYAEISRRLAMPVGSIGPVRARALRRLREALAPDGCGARSAG